MRNENDVLVNFKLPGTHTDSLYPDFLPLRHAGLINKISMVVYVTSRQNEYVTFIYFIAHLKKIYFSIIIHNSWSIEVKKYKSKDKLETWMSMRWLYGWIWFSFLWFNHKVSPSWLPCSVQFFQLLSRDENFIAHYYTSIFILMKYSYILYWAKWCVILRKQKSCDWKKMSANMWNSKWWNVNTVQ